MPKAPRCRAAAKSGVRDSQHEGACELASCKPAHAGACNSQQQASACQVPAPSHLQLIATPGLAMQEPPTGKHTRAC